MSVRESEAVGLVAAISGRTRSSALVEIGPPRNMEGKGVADMALVKVAEC